METGPKATAGTPEAAFSQHPITVLLVDDQPIIGEAVRRMLAEEDHITLHYCSDPTKALGLAAAIAPTVILQDLVMPEVDGLMLVQFFRAHAATRDIPLIVLSATEEPMVKAEAFARGANDYLVKLPDKIELIARIRHHSQGYINLLQRNEAHQALTAQQQLLLEELAEAAAYVTSLLPAPLTDDVRTAWRYIPSTQLGGDSFGYHWLDAEHFAMYLLDVCGHGVGAALLAVSVMHVLRSHGLPGTDLHNPAAVLQALNTAFPMEQHNNRFFTMWYGVYNKVTRQLVYASAGHPPAILVTGATAATAQVARLRTPGMAIGSMAGLTFTNARRELEAFSMLYVLSDGVYEIQKPNGSMLTFEEFVACLAPLSQSGDTDIDRVVRAVQDIGGSVTFEDDFSLLQVIFG